MQAHEYMKQFYRVVVAILFSILFFIVFKVIQLFYPVFFIPFTITVEQISYASSSRTLSVCQQAKYGIWLCTGGE